MPVLSSEVAQSPLLACFTHPNAEHAHDAIRARGNASDSLREFLGLQLAHVYFAIGTGGSGDAGTCAQCAAAQDGVEGAAMHRERECIHHVAGLTILTNPGPLSFAPAVALAAYTKPGHGRNARSQALHTHINRALYNVYASNAETRATAVEFEQLTHNFIACLRHAVRDVASYRPPAHVVSAMDEDRTLHVFRGVGPGTRDALCSLTKHELWFMPGFCSTSTSREIAQWCATDAAVGGADVGAVLHIEVPQDHRPL
eukprot:CAMPEP_0174863922 /NCGR_PEP_ID=MMETSP1114-20130205/57255_1 /TAXON_ID=312471 /ORGANISM="Neobodo designis, Strain CCAP 1951/1" /LENGTH=256 /DNA_ID=CAMNT_0016098999 /DNA_START=214 /DNA_END=981 /DNA_ORIENTATION=+